MAASIIGLAATTTARTARQGALVFAGTRGMEAVWGSSAGGLVWEESRNYSWQPSRDCQLASMADD